METPWQEIMSQGEMGVHKLLSFLDASPSPYHAVENLVKRLAAVGFKPLAEGASWADKVQPGGKFYFSRNGSALVAVAVGGKYEAGNGIKMVAAHTDSPCLKVKPISKRRAKDDFLQVAVETYGGGLWNTWFDRDLGVAGKLVTLDSKTGRLTERLVNVCAPVLRIPSLAIHLDRSVKDGFTFNTELQLSPVLATVSTDKMSQSAGDSDKASHHRALLGVLQPDAKAGLDEELVSTDLCLYDVQKAALGGAYKEFILSARLDNLMLSFCTAEVPSPTRGRRSHAACVGVCRGLPPAGGRALHPHGHLVRQRGVRLRVGPGRHVDLGLVVRGPRPGVPRACQPQPPGAGQ